jgi:MFS transporter, PAT family, beta-lactamase induction signal transducer AmpG
LETATKHIPPWLFGVLSLPYGIGSAIITILIPYLLRKQGVSVGRIAPIVAIANIPAIWYFVYAPVVDMAWRRRTWLFFAAGGAAACSAVAVWISASSLGAVTFLLFLATAISGLLSAANGALLTTLPATVHGRTAGWYNAGNIGGGAVGGGLAIWLADAASVHTVSLCVALLIALPILAAFRIEEPPLPHKAAWPRILSLSHDLRALATSKRTIAGLVFFLSPVGSAAIANLISGVGPDYRASGREVLMISGIGGGLLNALGCLAGGLVCGRFDVRKAYVTSGMLAAVFGGYLALGPHSPITYGAGYSGYALASGLAYAVFTTLVLEVLGPGRAAAASGYSLLVASGNVPIVYMTWLDGVGYQHWGARGLMTVDALANGLGAIALLIFGYYVREIWKRSPDS